MGRTTSYYQVVTGLFLATAGGAVGLHLHHGTPSFLLIAAGALGLALHYGYWVSRPPGFIERDGSGDWVPIDRYSFHENHGPAFGGMAFLLVMQFITAWREVRDDGVVVWNVDFIALFVAPGMLALAVHAFMLRRRTAQLLSAALRTADARDSDWSMREALVETTLELRTRMEDATESDPEMAEEIHLSEGSLSLTSLEGKPLTLTGGVWWTPRRRFGRGFVCTLQAGRRVRVFGRWDGDRAAPSGGRPVLVVDELLAAPRVLWTRRVLVLLLLALAAFTAAGIFMEMPEGAIQDIPDPD